MISRANFQSPQNCCGCTLRGPVSEQQSKSFKTKIPVDTKPDNKDSFRKAQNRNLLNTAAAPQVQAGLYSNTNANIEAQIIQNIIQMIVSISSIIAKFSQQLGSGLPSTGGNPSAPHQPGGGSSGFPVYGDSDITITIPASHDVIIQIGRPGNGGKPDHPGFPQAPKAGETLSRLVPANYADGRGEIRVGNLPNPREISNAVSDQGDQKTENSKGASDRGWWWGQFIDRDLVLARAGGEEA
ncbi:MAG: peroxidase family protein, partial [Pseudomonadota bacterium]